MDDSQKGGEIIQSKVITKRIEELHLPKERFVCVASPVPKPSQIKIKTDPAISSLFYYYSDFSEIFMLN